MDYFSKLDKNEIEMMYRAPVDVAILIAGADGHIDKSEIRKAISLTHDKTVTARPDLLDFYANVAEGFEDKLKVRIASLPINVPPRSDVLIAELKQLNEILPKLELEFARDFYWSIRDLAKKIANSSGGVLGYLAIGYEESKLIGLDMINNPDI